METSSDNDNNQNSSVDNSSTKTAPVHMIRKPCVSSKPNRPPPPKPKVSTENIKKEEIINDIQSSPEKNIMKTGRQRRGSGDCRKIGNLTQDSDAVLRSEVSKYSASISLEDLFRLLESINVKNLQQPQIPISSSKKTRFGFFSSSSSNQSDNIEKQPFKPSDEDISLFLSEMHNFFQREKTYWITFFRGTERNSRGIHEFNHQAKSKRPWAFVFNNFMAENPAGAWFYNCLHSSKTSIYCDVISKFIELEFQKSNTDNTLKSFPIIERAKLLLNFLQTHKEDPYSCIIGHQARQHIVSECINTPILSSSISHTMHSESSENNISSNSNNDKTSLTSSNVLPSSEIPFDLVRYLMEVSTLKSDSELARNVRVFSAKLRGISKVKQGDLLLLALPSLPSECTIPPESIKANGKIYNPTGLGEFVNLLNNSLLYKSSYSGAYRGIYARCAVKPTNNNWIGLWVGTRESDSSIIWAPMSSVYKLDRKYLECLENPDTDLQDIISLVVDQSELLESEFSSFIENEILEFIRKEMKMSNDKFKNLLKSGNSFSEEKNRIAISRQLEQLSSNPEMIDKLNIIPILMEKRNEYLEQIDTNHLFAPNRRAIIKKFKNRTKEDFKNLVNNVARELKMKSDQQFQMLNLSRRKLLDGSRKRHITGWWLKETRRTVQTFLKELGYQYDAIPKDYTVIPPDNLSLVSRNLELVMTVLDESSKLHKKLNRLIKGLKLRIYPRMNDLLKDFSAVMLYSLDLEVSEETIENFNLEEISNLLNERQNDIDKQLYSQLQEMTKDIEYLIMMEVLENDFAKRVNYPHIVPISGLVVSSIVRLQTECRTVLELWGGDTLESPKSKTTNSSRYELEKGKSEADMKIYLKLKERGISQPHTKDTHDRTPLHVQCRAGDLLAAKEILSLSSIDVNCVDDEGELPLHGLVQMQVDTHDQKQLVFDIIRKMVDKNVEIDHPNNLGETPLFIAVRQRKIDLACLLLELNATLNQEVKDYLIENPSPQISEFLDKQEQ